MTFQLSLHKVIKMNNPGVGIGVIIINPKGEILIGKRKGSHAPFYSIPGGKLDLGESFEEAAIREVQEETGLLIVAPKVLCVTNNLRTFHSEQQHYVSVNLIAQSFSGTLKVMEKEKCESWEWYDPNSIPKPHFDASEFAIECYLEKSFYIIDQQ